jgi:hypothetical protein
MNAITRQARIQMNVEVIATLDILFQRCFLLTTNKKSLTNHKKKDKTAANPIKRIINFIMIV